MKKITNVKVIITEQDGEEEITTDLSAPTIDMAIEKMGAFERMRDKEDTLFEGQEELEETENE